MKKILTAITVTIGIVATTMSTAFASEYDIDNMTLEEMKEAITTLESEKAELEDQVKDLKVQLFDLQQGSSSVEETVEETEAIEETEVEKVQKTTEEFLEDIKQSFDARAIAVDRYTTSEINTMSDDEFVAYRQGVVGEEEPFLEEYRNAEFEDLNIQYLCKTYCDGVQAQINSCKKYIEDKDYSAWDNTWTAAYNKRSYVIVELSEYYNVPFGDVSEMAENVAALDSLNEAETRNAEVDHETVRQTQELLNTIGFFCGNADGISGKRTVKSIKRFQEMYGYDPIDGMIDDELIGQLEEVAAKKAPVEETETED